MRKLRKIYKDEYEPTFPVPEFFTYITDANIKKEETKHDHRIVGCPMQFVYDGVKNEKSPKRSSNGIPLSDILTINDISNVDTKMVNKVLKKADDINTKRNKLNSQFRTNRFKVHNTSIQNAITRETTSFFRSIKQEKLTEATIASLIKFIDEAGTQIREEHWLLLAALCNSGKNGEMDFATIGNARIYDMLKKNPLEADYDPDRIKKELFWMFRV